MNSPATILRMVTSSGSAVAGLCASGARGGRTISAQLRRIWLKTEHPLPTQIRPSVCLRLARSGRPPAAALLFDNCFQAPPRRARAEAHALVSPEHGLLRSKRRHPAMRPVLPAAEFGTRGVLAQRGQIFDHAAARIKRVPSPEMA